MTARSKPVLFLGLAVLAACSSLRAQQAIRAITRPSNDVTLSFVRPGRIAKVLVAEGDDVKAGQELIRLDDESELAQLEQLQAQAEDDTRVRAADAQLAQKKVDLKKNELALKQGAATVMEVEHAKLEVTISELSLELAVFQRKQDQRKYREAMIQHARMRLTSPIDGKVERPADATGKPLVQSLVESGESVDSLEKIIRVVKIDPLIINVPVRLSQARRLKKGAKAQVFGALEAKSPGDPIIGPLLFPNAKVILVAAVADAASDTLTVRIEAPNPTARPVGEGVFVEFTPSKTATSSGPDEPGKVASRPATRDRT